MKYKLVFTVQFKEDLKYWNKHCAAKYKRICNLMREIEEQPFASVGKGNPEVLVHEYFQESKKRSRKIDKEHRLVYAVSKDTISFIQARFHYTKKGKK